MRRRPSGRGKRVLAVAMVAYLSVAVPGLFLRFAGHILAGDAFILASVALSFLFVLGNRRGWFQ